MDDDLKELRDLIIKRGWGYYKRYYLAIEDRGVYIVKASYREKILLEDYSIEDVLIYIDLLG